MKKIVLSTLVCSMISGGFAFANFTMADMPKVDNTIVVSATRTNELLKNVSADMSVISRKEIEERHYTNLMDALQDIPGVAIVNDIHDGKNVIIRGSESRHVLVLVDGKRVATDLTKKRANIGVFENINMDDVQRVEILRGSSSALYGSEAMGGVINVILKKDAKPSITLKSEVVRRKGVSKLGSSYSVDINSGKKGKWNGRLAVTANENISSLNPTSGQAIYEGTRMPVHLDLNYDASNKDKFGFSFDYRHDNLQQNFQIMEDGKKIREEALAGINKGIAGINQGIKGITQGITQVQAMVDKGTKAIADAKAKLNDPAADKAKLNAEIAKNEGMLKQMKPGLDAMMKKKQGMEAQVKGMERAKAGIAHMPDLMIINMPQERKSSFKQYAFTYDGKRKNTDIHGRIYFNAYHDKYAVKLEDLRTHSFAYTDWDKSKRRDIVGELQFDTSLNDQHLLTYGIEYRHEKVEGTRIHTDDLKRIETLYGIKESIYGSTLGTMSYYLQDNWTPNEKWIITPAVRVDTFTKFASKVSPKLGITYKKNKTLRYKMNLGTGYATPGFTERFTDWVMFRPGIFGPGSPGMQFKGNPDLKPERSKSFDLSVEKDYKKSNLKLTYFDTHVKNYIDYRMNRALSSREYQVMEYQNETNARLKGVEFAASYKLHPHWDVNLSYTYLDARNDDTNKRLPAKAYNTIGAALNYHVKDWMASIYGNIYQNYLDELPTSHGQLFTKRNLKIFNFIMSHKVNKNMECYFGIENILNEKDWARDLNGGVYRFGVCYKI